MVVKTETEATIDEPAEVLAEAAPVEDEAIAEEPDAEAAEEEAIPDAPELSMSMKKEELLEAARMKGVQVSSRATKAAIIEAIEKAAEEETDNN